MTTTDAGDAGLKWTHSPSPVCASRPLTSCCQTTVSELQSWWAPYLTSSFPSPPAPAPGASYRDIRNTCRIDSRMASWYAGTPSPSITILCTASSSSAIRRAAPWTASLQIDQRAKCQSDQIEMFPSCSLMHPGGLPEGGVVAARPHDVGVLGC